MTDDTDRSSLRALFDRALDLEPGERARFVDQLALAGDERAERLRRMLGDDAAPSPLDSTPWAHFDAATAGEIQAGAEATPTRLGPYRILSEIGRGGMGRVYLAEQEGAGFRRTVALKVVAGDGAASDEIERRFRAERAILARLEHSGIARFYDAGRSADGQLYLALEHVAGANLIEHARQHELPIEGRIRLFLSVLEAVTYAHERGIVHRDLKPANILVGADARPRLLDFGIAKLLDPTSSVLGGATAAPTTTATMPGARTLTPAYASPEQFRGDPITRPRMFSRSEWCCTSFSPARALLPRRTVRRSSSNAPSCTTNRQRPAGPHVAAPMERALRARVSRDLDAICFQALRKAPEARYPSAAEFARDLERYLARLPVAARGVQRRYRFGRFPRRHAATFVIIGALVAAFVAGSTLLPRADSRRRGEVEEPPPRPFPFSDVSASEAPALEAQFISEPASLETGAHLAMSLAKGGRIVEARLLLPRLRQIPGRADDPLIDYVEASLAVAADEPQRALVLFERALTAAFVGGRGELVSQIRAARGRLLSTLGRGDAARTDMSAALAGFEASGDAPSLARVLNDLAVEELQRGRLAEGEALLERALAASREANPGGSGGGVMLGNLAGISMLRGRPDAAAPRCHEAIRLFRANGSHRLAWALTDCSEIFRDLAQTAEADSALAEAIALLEGGPSEGDLGIALGFRGDADLAAGDLALAVATASRLERTATSSGDKPAQAQADRLRAGLAAAQGDLATARRLLAEARTLISGSGQEDIATEIALQAARIELEFGEVAAAAEWVERALDSPAGQTREGSIAFFAAILRAEIDLRTHRLDEARELLDSAGDPERLPSLHRRLALLAARGHLAAADGRRAEARQDLVRAHREAESNALRVRALELRLDLARLDEGSTTTVAGAEGRLPQTRSRERQAVVDEAERLGLLHLAKRAAET